ncbi:MULTISPECIES: DUF3288 family protein [unclassified Nodosilinea]|jgi:hypothetical protein|uniref:DUF3288 family protein n=1 Tax=Leptolyngbya subtilissima DQ-A4 TaxID=2933933 RepID=A0ABV0K1S4_9CYAN|nr:MULTISPECIES: DUF3288 family protein [unclassified Nodosilinea]MBD2107323.1 DUF3288 family protein [Nodosilinea sp. FACHB-13]MBD2111490.1 DUF3288 family protein [Nodosilinea sp. FACHB-141]MBW4482661.1 DUF3288 family protein [Tildeniella torsiva UHER 1998/13D]PZV05881.1 MAG: DUF3288 domain-containing protein [Leptolyngbya sp.]
MADITKDQQHPQYKTDRQVVNQLLAGEATDFNLVELARLMTRYEGFPGARDIQTDLKKALNRWQLTEAELFEKTRAIHQQGEVYKGLGRGREDWS